MTGSEETHDEYQGVVVPFEVQTHDAVGDLLRRVRRVQIPVKAAADAVAGKNHQVGRPDGDDTGAQGRQLITDHATAQHGVFGTRCGQVVRAEQQALDVANASQLTVLSSTLNE